MEPRLQRERTLLVDADSLTYSLAYANQHAIPWTADLWTYHGDMGKARIQLRDFMEDVLETTGCGQMRVALTDSGRNYRRLVHPAYKANRLPAQRPILFRPLREQLLEEFGAEIWPWLEGDDLVSIWSTELACTGVICSIDKDCMGVPGSLYNPMQSGQGVIDIDTDTADRFFYSQVLTGDRTDGYPGVPGVGPKKAEALMRDVPTHELWSRVIVPAYVDAGLTAELALENARCARVLRAGEYDDNGRILLWSPPGWTGDRAWLDPNDADSADDSADFSASLAS